MSCKSSPSPHGDKDSPTNLYESERQERTPCAPDEFVFLSVSRTLPAGLGARKNSVEIAQTWAPIVERKSSLRTTKTTLGKCRRCARWGYPCLHRRVEATVRVRGARPSARRATRQRPARFAADGAATRRAYGPVSYVRPGLPSTPLVRSVGGVLPYARRCPVGIELCSEVSETLSKNMVT